MRIIKNKIMDLNQGNDKFLIQLSATSEVNSCMKIKHDASQ